MRQAGTRVFRCLPVLSLGVGALLLAGCERAEPVTYRIPKEARTAETQRTPSSSQPAPPAGRDGSADGTAALRGGEASANQAGNIDYSVPDGWEAFPAAGIRKANFRVTDEEENGSAEVTVLVFPGDAGGDLANVNRWAGQLGLDLLTAQDLAEISQPCAISGHDGLFVRLRGPSESILGGILPFHGSTWFFKMQGDNAIVLGQETAMKEFLASVVLEDGNH